MLSNNHRRNSIKPRRLKYNGCIHRTGMNGQVENGISTMPDTSSLQHLITCTFYHSREDKLSNFSGRQGEDRDLVFGRTIADEYPRLAKLRAGYLI